MASIPIFPTKQARCMAFRTTPIDYVMTETPVPLGWMRSVYALQAAFALESFIDELAVAAGKDPLKYRLQLLAKGSGPPLLHHHVAYGTHARRAATRCRESRMGQAAARRALPRRRLLRLLPSYMAEVVEITMENDQPRVHRVVAVVDCGQVVNPSILEQQIQGGIVYGLGNALRAKITIEKGRIVQGNFDDYAPLRMDETPVS